MKLIGTIRQKGIRYSVRKMLRFFLSLLLNGSGSNCESKMTQPLSYEGFIYDAVTQTAYRCVCVCLPLNL